MKYIFEKLTKDERSLLLFFEDMAVNKFGWIDNPQKMNDTDLKIAVSWNMQGFVSFKRATKRGSDGEIIQATYALVLSPEAWEMASRLRKERAERHIPDVFTT